VRDTGGSEVVEVIRRVFEAGSRSDLEGVKSLHSNSYTRFSDMPPYRIQSCDEALKLKMSLFSELIDFSYSLSDIEVKMVGDVAIVTCILTYRGMYVYSYTFEGRPISVQTRCTTVLAKEEGEWKVLHEHLSRVPVSE